MLPALPVTLYPKKAKILGLLAISVAFTAIGFWMGTTGEWLGWLCGGFFALGAVVFVVQLLPGASSLMVDEDGFEYRTMFRQTRMHWSDISHFGTYALRSNGLPVGEFVGFDFSAACPTARRMRSVSKSLSGFEGALPDTYGMKAADLAGLLAAVHAAAVAHPSSPAAPMPCPAARPDMMPDP